MAGRRHASSGGAVDACRIDCVPRQAHRPRRRRRRGPSRRGPRRPSPRPGAGRRVHRRARLHGAAYLERMDAHAATLLAQRAPRGYGASVATTWSLAFEQLEDDGDTRRLLDACSALAPDPIPDAVVEALIPDVLRRDRAVEAALRYSLVTTRGRALVMHPLVQQVAQLRLSDEEREAAATSALKAVTAAFPQTSMLAETWPSCLALLPHVAQARQRRDGQGRQRLFLDPDRAPRRVPRRARRVRRRAAAAAEPGRSARDSARR